MDRLQIFEGTGLTVRHSGPFSNCSELPVEDLERRPLNPVAANFTAYTASLGVTGKAEFITLYLKIELPQFPGASTTSLRKDQPDKASPDASWIELQGVLELQQWRAAKASAAATAFNPIPAPQPLQAGRLLRPEIPTNSCVDLQKAHRFSCGESGQR